MNNRVCVTIRVKGERLDYLDMILRGDHCLDELEVLMRNLKPIRIFIRPENELFLDCCWHWGF